MKSQERSKIEYDKIHKEVGFEEESEYYETLGLLLKGKKAVDIGCGYGFVEDYAPDTMGVDFSEEALKVARKRGLKNTIKAPAEKLPFKDNEYEVALSNGVLEHVSDINAAIKEMIRVSKLQVYVVHAALPFELEKIRKPLIGLFGLKDQPIERPQTLKDLKAMIRGNGGRIIVEGVWNYIDLRWLWRKLPYGLVKWPSHHFIISIKTNNLDRKYLGKEI